MTAGDRPTTPFADAGALRDALVTAFLTPARRDDGPYAVLLAHAPDATLLVRESDARLFVLLPWTVATAPDRAALQSRLDAAFALLPSTVIAGLDRWAIAAFVIGAPPFARWNGVPVRSLVFPRPIAWCGVSLAGSVTTNATPFGNRPDDGADYLDALAPFIDRARTFPVPLDSTALDAARIAGVTELEEAARFARTAHPSRQLATLSLVVFNVLVFVVLTRWGDAESSRLLSRAGATYGPWIARGEWWRLITAGYLHAGFKHLGGNVLGLLMAGPILEAALGPARFVVLTTACLIAGNALSAWTAGENLAVGFSGAALGLTAALGSIAARRRHLLPETGRSSVRSAMVVLVVINVFASFLPGVSLAAHAGGIIAGLLAVWTHAVTYRLPQRWKGERASTRVRATWDVLAALCVAVTLVAFVVAWRTERPWELRTPSFVRIELAGSGTSIEVPWGTPSRTARHALDGGTEYIFGDLALDPATIAITVFSAVDAPSDDALDARLGALRDEYASPAHDRTLRHPPAVVRVAERPWLFLDQTDANHARVPRWVGYAGDHLIDLEVTFTDDASDAWRTAGEHVLASLAR